MKNIFFLGCGKMGSILAKSLVKENIAKASQIKVLKKSSKNKIAEFDYFKNFQDLPKNYQADLVFIAIKPQNCEKILIELSSSKVIHKNTIFISILAGKKVSFFENIFGENAKIVRSMPNLPIQYSQGILAYLCNKNITKSEIENLKGIFEKFGMSFQLKDEKLFDLITAIAGSGPAYIFLLQEIFSEIAITLGIKKTDATNLIKKLFLGSALMSEFSPEKFSDLRKSVTSKNGTTESAIKVLQKNSTLKNIFKKAIDAASKKSNQLAKN